MQDTEVDAPMANLQLQRLQVRQPAHACMHAAARSSNTTAARGRQPCC